MKSRKSRTSNFSARCVRPNGNAAPEVAPSPPDSMIASWVSPDCPPEIARQFWKDVAAFEEAQDIVLFDHLIAVGIALPPPTSLSDAEISTKLWEVIGALATLGTYLHYTDHLSDRDLYAYLWTAGLREPTKLFPGDLDFAYHIDLLGSGSEEDVELFLKYHADDETRRTFANDLPGLTMPDRQAAPFQRDAALPKPRNR